MKSNLKLLTVCTFAAWLSFIVSAPAQSFTSLFSFDDLVASGIYGGLAISGNTLFGTAFNGSTNGYNGSIYSYTPNAVCNPLHFFSGSDGQNPSGGVTISGNTMFGTTQQGGSGSGGVIYKMDLNGSNYTVLKYLSNATNGIGGYPSGSLVLADGVLYGTCSKGGSSLGLVFSINTNGSAYTPMKIFSGPDGGDPSAGLFLSGDTLYGTTATGSGAGLYGTVFKINTNGMGFSTLHAFAYSDGCYPFSSVVVASNYVYGTTFSGGDYSSGAIFRIGTDGGGFTNLHHFDGPSGGQTFSGLTLVGNVLYGSCTSGGKYNHGNLFRMNTDGTGFSVLADFNGTNGAGPYASMILVSNTLYGTTDVGGSESFGTIFQLVLSQFLPSQIIIHPASDGKIQLDYTGIPGTNYVLDAAYNVTSPVVWHPAATNTAAFDSSIHFTNTVTSTNTYWRIRSSP